jgi:hypothetical protein
LSRVPERNEFLISRQAIRSAWTIARSIWLARRFGFVALLSAALVCGWLYHLLSPALLKGEGADLLGYLPMGLSIFLTFVLCNFTENDRRGRLDGFPSRLFTVPVTTPTLVAGPIVFSVLAVSAIYVVWAKLALPALGREMPLGWPVLYLQAGMICYQSLVWVLARYRVVRLLVLGLSGTVFATGWLTLRRGAENDFGFTSEGVPVRVLICAALVVMSLGAWMLATVIVENQRRGGINKWKGWRSAEGARSGTGDEYRGQRTLLERIADALPRRQTRFRSPAQAQFWFEWRRHGSLLPMATGGVLLLILAPAPWCAPIGAERAGIVLCWIIALPPLLAWVLGKGFGKADLWSKEPGLPLFHATRPLSNTDWIGAKMRAATLATMCSWAIVLGVTPLWLWLWCDWQSLLQQWRTAVAYDPGVFSSSLAVLPILVVFTWRFLIGSLYVGLSGKTWMINVAACGVFLSLFAPLVGAAPIVQDNLHYLLFTPRWFPWLLTGLFAAKATAAVVVTRSARRKGFVSDRAIRRYLVVWLGIATSLILLIWQLIPFEHIPARSGWNRPMFALLALLLVPLLRVAYAPIALAKNRWR